MDTLKNIKYEIIITIPRNKKLKQGGIFLLTSSEKYLFRNNFELNPPINKQNEAAA